MEPKKIFVTGISGCVGHYLYDVLAAVHLAASWGSRHAFRINVEQTLRLDGSFHFIHAHDIAVMVHHLLKQEMSERRLILGNPPISLDQCIEKLCDTAGKKRRSAVNLTPLLVKVVPKLLKKRLSPWDLYSLRRRHFRYAAVFPASFGLPSLYDTLEKCIEK